MYYLFIIVSLNDKKMNIEDLAEEFTEEESKQCLEKALALFTTISTKKSISFKL